MKRIVSYTSRVRLVPAQKIHINRIANNMRLIDQRECRAMGRTPKHSLRQCLARSSNAWTALVDDQPEAMFGVIIESVIGQEGTPWFLGTDEVYRHARELMMWGPPMLSRMSNSKLTLSNLVSSDNDKAIRLLKKWGFEVDEKEQHIGGEAFRPFVREFA